MEKKILSELAVKLANYPKLSSSKPYSYTVPYFDYHTSDQIWEVETDTYHNDMWEDTVFDEMISLTQECMEKLEALHKVTIQVLQQDYKKEIMDEREKTRPDQGMALTISPLLGTTPQACLECIDIMRSMSKTLKYTPVSFVIEQTQEDPDQPYKGFHIHMSGTSKMPPSTLSQYFNKIFTGKRGKPQANCYCRYANSGWLDNYMMGKKIGKDQDETDKKARRCAVDVKMRAEYAFKFPELFSPLKV